MKILVLKSFRMDSLHTYILFFNTFFQFLEASSPVIIDFKEMSQYVHKLFFLINVYNLRHSRAN